MPRYDRLPYLCLAEFDDGGTDSLDAYMQSVSDHLDKTKRSELKHQLHELRRVSGAPVSLKARVGRGVCWGVPPG